MSGEKDFLDDFVDDESAGIVEPVQTEVEPVSSGRQRGPDGKFIKAEAERQAIEAEKGAKQAADDAAFTEPPSDEDEGQTVPLSALKALRKELQELKRSQGTSGQTQPKPQAPGIPTPSVAFDQDPQRFIEESFFSQKTHISKVAAQQQYGAQLADEAWTAFVTNNDPLVVAYSHQLVNHPHPVGEMVKWYQEQQELRAIREAGGVENLIQQRLAAMGGQATAQAPANVPPSLAGTGKPRSSNAADGLEDGFDALFKR